MSAPPVVAVTASKFTEACVEFARASLAAAGYAVRVFDADGPAFEQFVRAGYAVGVLDLTTGDLTHGTGRASDRLTAASLAGVPQVISLGGLDAVAVGVGPAGTPRRTTPEECDRLGQEVALKACAARGPTAILVPLRGLSTLDTGGVPLEANAALFQSLRNWVYGVELVELDAHLNDREFGEACAVTLLRLLRVTNVSQSVPAL